VQQAGNNDRMSWGSTGNRATDYSNHAKQHQTRATGSTASDTTPSAPLPQGDALVAYEKVKQEKNSEGKENGEIKFDINVRRV